MLRFIRRSRQSADVKHLAPEQIAELKSKIGDLQAVMAPLQDLADVCSGDQGPDGPILADLGSDAKHRKKHVRARLDGPPKMGSSDSATTATACGDLLNRDQ
ncbi:MAG: hypothetical protein ORN49_04850 [Rhodobacteraceae bacterium]|nr:hypothetical protein [Paracoccaceae bacterium]